MHKRFAFRLAVAAALALAGATSAFAQAYPNKPIRFVVGFPAGSSIDVVSRIVLDDIRVRTNATIIVENKPGALGALGIDNVQRAPADGYTLMPSSSATHSSGPSLGKALQKLDPVGGLTHIARVVRFDIAVVTATSGPHKNAKALIDASKAKPESLTYGFGSGTGQIGSAAFSHAAGIKARAIPYKGQPAAITDLLGGQVDFVSSDLGAVLGFLKQGNLTPVAVLAERRSSFLPDVPTAREAGLDPVILGGWIGIDGPAKLPADVLAWWNEQLRLTMAVPAVQEKLRTVGMEPALLAGEPFVKFVEAERDRWGGHVKTAGLQPE
jgi:tripartite-type tricarboxylate transporter receptor subunit TctC